MNISQSCQVTHDDVLYLAVHSGDTMRGLIERARESVRRDAMTWAIGRNLPETEGRRVADDAVELFEAVMRNQDRQ